MPESIKSYIEDLFKYISSYEAQSAEFETEAFFQTYNGIYAVFHALRQQRDKAIDVDQYFLEKIRHIPLNSSDLRQLTIQILITYFESEADTDGQSNAAYLHCRELRIAKRDVAFFQQSLMPILFKEGSLNNNEKLRMFFLKEIARYTNKFVSGVNVDLTPEAFNAMSEPLKILELARRRQELGTELFSDRNSLEFHLRRVEGLKKLGDKGKIFAGILTEWRYLEIPSFWGKVKKISGVLWAKFKGVFSSFRYFRLVLTQRNPAYLYYGLIIALFLVLAILVPMRWAGHSQDVLQKMNDRAVEIQQKIGN
jgi:hypothetical protein